MIRVLVVDDSPTARALLVEILRSDPGVEVVGEATNGIDGVELTRKLRPDLVTMDVQMPRMDGFAATKEIMINVPTPTIIVTTGIATGEVDLAMQALRAGALAALRKPPGPDAPGFEDAAQQLLTTVKSMVQVKVVRHWREAAPGPAPVAQPPPRSDARGAILAVASSTGGPGALQQVLSRFGSNFPVPILVVQHNTPGFMPGLARWLGSECALRVKVAEPGEPLRPGSVYLAPDGRHLGVAGRGSVMLSAEAPVGGFRPSGTFLFESVARSFGAATVALILTGMGDDGVEGLRAVRRAGGRILAQDEKSSVVWGMPGAAVAAGLADAVLSLDLIPTRLLELIARVP